MADEEITTGPDNPAAVREEATIDDKSGQPLIHGAAEMQAQMNEEDEAGYRGERFNPVALDEYTLRTGPKGPTVVEEQIAMAKEAAPNV